MSMCLSRDLLERPEFREAIKYAIKAQKAKFRILILDPTSKIAAQRAREEDKREFLPTIEQSLIILQEIKQSLGPEMIEMNFQVRVINCTNVYCQIVRVDDVMLVTNYLCHSSGGMSPALELMGKETSWFVKFLDEFAHIWKLAAGYPLVDKINSDEKEQ